MLRCAAIVLACLGFAAPGFKERRFQLVFAADPRMTPYWQEWAQEEGHPIAKPGVSLDGAHACACDVILVDDGPAAGASTPTSSGLARLVQATPPNPEAVSLLGRPLYAISGGSELAQLEEKLAAARRDLSAHPNDPARIVWVGRRLGYLWRMNEAIEVFTGGIRAHPEYAPFYRHRGHRYISLRQFDEAIADLEKAAGLIEGKPDEIEADGQPNARNIPLTTLGFNVWYHLALARYLKGDFAGAARAYETNLKYLGGRDDNLVAVTDWHYMTLRRLDRREEAAALLTKTPPQMTIIENAAYHQRLLMYKGLLKPEDLLDVRASSDLDAATQGYGVGNWYLYNGDRAKAKEIFERVVAGKYWPSFGFIAAEVQLATERQRADNR